MKDAVHHPAHYTRYQYEVIELTENLDFCVGNACKYILRAPFKGNEKQDLEKALWYMERAKKNIVPDCEDYYRISLKVALYFSALDPAIKDILRYLQFENETFLNSAIEKLKKRLKKDGIS